jgi:glycosyltransferase involved in cell wall biosynthesis
MIPKHLKRAVECFQRQTLPNREPIIVTEKARLNDAEAILGIRNFRSIRWIGVMGDPTLGEMRNVGIMAAEGRWIAQWDEDDWHFPERLSTQLKLVVDAGAEACTLMRTWMVDEDESPRSTLGDRIWLTRPRVDGWENTLLCRRTVIGEVGGYPLLRETEDTPVLSMIRARRRLLIRDNPDLYAYTFHGDNVWNRGHWESLRETEALIPFEAMDRIKLRMEEVG